MIIWEIPQTPQRNHLQYTDFNTTETLNGDVVLVIPTG